MRIDTVLISVSFLKVQTGISGLTITDSLSLRLRKLVVVSDEDACNENGKTSTPPPPIPSTHSHYFYTLLIPSQKVTFPYLPVASLDFHSTFSTLVSYSLPSPPICFEVFPSYHKFWSPIKLESKALSSYFGIRLQQQHKDKNMLLKCLTVVHQSLMVRCFPYALDFSQSNNTFHGISVFFKHKWSWK